MTCCRQKLTVWPGKSILSLKKPKTPKIMDNFWDMLTLEGAWGQTDDTRLTLTIFSALEYTPKWISGQIWAHIWARQIWSKGVSLKRSCKMQFRRVGLRSIGPSSQKLWPNQIFGRFPHCNYNVKLKKDGRMSFKLKSQMKSWMKSI